MTKILAALALPVLIAFLVGCDAKPAPAPAPEPDQVSALPAPPPPPEVLPADALKAIGQTTLCTMFSRVVSTADKPIKPEDCVASATASDVRLATKDGTIALVAPVIWQGQTAIINQSMLPPDSELDAAHGGYSKVGLVIVGKAPANGLCMSAEYFAPHSKSDSIFVLPAGQRIRQQVDLSSGPQVQTKVLEFPVIPPGVIGAVLIERREPNTVLKSLSFTPCV